MGFRVLHANDAIWRPSRSMGALNTDLARQLGAQALGARLWRLAPRQASTKHRHPSQSELYVLLDGPGRMRVDDQLLVLEPLSAVLVEPDSVRQIFNDADSESLWLIAGAPPEMADTSRLTEQELARFYPEGPQALPPELRED